MTTYEIPTHNVARLQQAIEKLNRRAKRLGVEPIVLTLGATSTKTFKWTNEGGLDEKRTVEITQVVVDGEPPVVDGWRFLACMQHVPEVGTLILAVPGVSLPQYRDAAPDCDHCKAKRARRTTYALQEVESGKIMQVGSTCLHAFLPCASVDPNVIASRCEWLGELSRVCTDAEDMGWGGGGGSKYTDLAEYVAWVAKAIREVGWCSKGEAYGTSKWPTADVASNFMGEYAHQQRNGCSKHSDKIEPPTDEDRTRAAAALEWARGLVERKDELGDYEHNLMVACSPWYLMPKADGIVASVVRAHQRVLERQAADEARAQAIAECNAHLGAVGQRLEITVRVLTTREMPGDFGTTTLVKMRATTGELLTWYSSNGGLEIGKEYKLRATVKRHGEYKGAKETVVSRCTVVA